MDISRDNGYQYFEASVNTVLMDMCNIASTDLSCLSVTFLEGSGDKPVATALEQLGAIEIMMMHVS